MPEKGMSSKEKRVMEAHRLRYMEECSNKEIASRIGVSVPTVERYFSESESEKFKRFYSDQELFKLQQSLEQDVQDGNKLANNLLARAIQHDDAKPSTLVRASKQAQKIRERKISMLQELGIIDKPGDVDDGRQNGDTDGKSVREELAEIYKEQQEEKENEQKEKVEAE